MAEIRLKKIILIVSLILVVATFIVQYSDSKIQDYNNNIQYMQSVVSTERDVIIFWQGELNENKIDDLAVHFGKEYLPGNESVTSPVMLPIYQEILAVEKDFENGKILSQEFLAKINELYNKLINEVMRAYNKDYALLLGSIKNRPMFWIWAKNMGFIAMFVAGLLLAYLNPSIKDNGEKGK